MCAAGGKAFVGKPAPDFSASAFVDGEFKSISLSDYHGKYVVLFFYPNDFGYVCPTELVAFSDRFDDFDRIDTVLLAASTASVHSHMAWVEQATTVGGLGSTMRIALLGDKSHRLSRDYGVLNEAAGVAYRGLFIIDRKGIIRQITINDMTVGRSVDETLRLVQACQFIDAHGEGCPVNWRPGKATIKPGVTEGKLYFAREY